MLLLRRKPGVSMAMNALPSSSKRTSTLSRVVPGTSLTIIRSACASVLTSVLLPTFRRPTIATFITGSGGASSAASSGRFRQPLADRVEQFRLAAIFLGADADHLPREAVESVGLGLQRRRVGLVDHQHDGHGDVPQPFGHGLVQRDGPLAAIDDEQHDLGGIDRRLNLVLDLIGQVVDVFDAHAAGIDQFGETAVEIDQMGDAVARDPGRGIDDGKPLAREPIEDARFAHVGPADDHNLRNCHKPL